VRLSDSERKTSAELGKKLARKALEEVATIVTPETLLAWHLKFIAKKFDGSQQRKTLGRPTIDVGLEALVVRLAQENRSGGYDRIIGTLRHLGYTISDQTVGNSLKRHGMSSAPERQKTRTWHVLFFIHLSSWKLHIAGVTPSPNHAWMMQVACNVTMADWGPSLSQVNTSFTTMMQNSVQPFNGSLMMPALRVYHSHRALPI
jgi:putative transposase